MRTTTPCFRGCGIRAAMMGMQYARRMRSTAPKLKQHKKWPENRSQMHLPSPATRNKDMTPASSPQQNGTIRRRAKRNCRLIANPIQIANKNSDRKSVVYGKSVSVRVDLGGRRIIKKKKKKNIKKKKK